MFSIASLICGMIIIQEDTVPIIVFFNNKLKWSKMVVHVYWIKSSTVSSKGVLKICYCYVEIDHLPACFSLIYS